MIKKIWKNRKQISEGLINTIFKKEDTEVVASWRADICESNQCGYYDQTGISPKALMKGFPACGICGCNITLLTHSMSSKCSLHEIGLTPLWDQEVPDDNLPKDDQIQTA